MNTYIPVIGLEIHIELLCKSKMFCKCSADHFAKKPNTQVCPVCLGLPGALPFPNKKAIDYTIQLGKALGCFINQTSKFDRKHYNYPDLPKGYQISQYDMPLCSDGKFQIKENIINIKRIHIEEDTGKLIHQIVNGKKCTLIDFNRSGVPLAEMVTDPDFSDVKKVIEFLKEVQLIVKYLGISNADMEKGSMRLEANISLRKEESSKLPDYKVELKNINSFKFLEKALIYEIERQNVLLNGNIKVLQETRGFDQKTSKTYSQRLKEEANDYRYFPEPDIPPMFFDKRYLTTIENTMQKLPIYYRNLLKNYDLPENYIDILIGDKDRVEYFIKTIQISKKYNLGIKIISDFIVNKNFDKKYTNPTDLIKELIKISKCDYSTKEEVESAIKRVIANNQDAILKYQQGKTQIIQYLIGSVQKDLKGKGGIEMIRDLLIKNIKLLYQ